MIHGNWKESILFVYVFICNNIWYTIYEQIILNKCLFFLFSNWLQSFPLFKFLILSQSRRLESKDPNKWNPAYGFLPLWQKKPFHFEIGANLLVKCSTERRNTHSPIFFLTNSPFLLISIANVKISI